MLDNKQILADNLSRLLATRNESRLTLSRKMGVADGTLGRIKYGTGNPTLDALEGIARFFRIEVWQLFVPGLDPADLPPLPGSGGEAPSWPFARVSADALRSLSESDKAYVEGRLAEALSAAGGSKTAINE